MAEPSAVVRFKVRTRMEAAGLSESDILAACGLSTDALDKLEQGSCSGIRTSTLAGLLRALDCSPDDLIEVEWGEAREDEESGEACRPNLRARLGKLLPSRAPE